MAASKGRQNRLRGRCRAAGRAAALSKSMPGSASSVVEITRSWGSGCTSLQDSRPDGVWRDELLRAAQFPDAGSKENSSAVAQHGTLQHFLASEQARAAGVVAHTDSVKREQISDLSSG